MPQGGTTTIKSTAPLSMPTEQKWARDFNNNQQATTVADSLSLQNQNLNPTINQENINQELIQGAMRLNTGSIKEALGQATEIAGQMIFKEALKQSWLNLIESYGLTFLYINFHFIMAYLARNKYFCKFGEEGALNFGGKTDAVSQIDGGISKFLMEIAEIAILFTVNGLIIFILFLIACIISLIAWAATNPAEFLIETSGIAQEIINLIR